MGCDIHFVIERKHHGAWVGVYSTTSTPGLRDRDQPGHEVFCDRRFSHLEDRDYTFFGALAGVRRDGPDANGFPDDASALARLDSQHWGADGHSHGHCSLDEFVTKWFASQSDVYRDGVSRALADYKTVVANWRPDLWTWMFTHVDIDDDDGTSKDDYRVVFWFDN